MERIAKPFPPQKTFGNYPLIGTDIAIPSEYRHNCVLYANPSVIAGRVTDYSDQRNHGQIVGATYQAIPGGATLRGDGIDDLVIFPSIPAYNITEEITLACWINFATGSSTYARGISKQYNNSAASGSCYTLSINGSKPRFYLPGVAADLESDTAGIIGAGWKFLAGVYSSLTGRIILIRDGVIDKEGTGSGSIKVNVNEPVTLMGSKYHETIGYLCKGMQGESWIFNRALPVSEIFKLRERTGQKYGIAI